MNYVVERKKFTCFKYNRNHYCLPIILQGNLRKVHSPYHSWIIGRKVPLSGVTALDEPTKEHRWMHLLTACLAWGHEQVELENSLSPGHMTKNSPNRPVAWRIFCLSLRREGGFLKSFFFFFSLRALKFHRADKIYFNQWLCSKRRQTGGQTGFLFRLAVPLTYLLF